jgi:O-antigen biosynthesis protein
LGVGGVAGHAFKFFPKGSPGQRNRLNLTRQVTAVTGACLALRRDHFFQVGGFDEQNLKITLNDVDLCLKLMAQGFVNVVPSRAVLYHHESASRGIDSSGEIFDYERKYAMEKWKPYFQRDRNYNPNLSLKFEDYSFNFPPALKKKQ